MLSCFFVSSFWFFFFFYIFFGEGVRDESCNCSLFGVVLGINAVIYNSVNVCCLVYPFLLQGFPLFLSLRSSLFFPSVSLPLIFPLCPSFPFHSIFLLCFHTSLPPVLPFLAPGVCLLLLFYFSLIHQYLFLTVISSNISSAFSFMISTVPILFSSHSFLFLKFSCYHSYHLCVLFSLTLPYFFISLFFIIKLIHELFS